jgi:hypothetical protein
VRFYTLVDLVFGSMVFYEFCFLADILVEDFAISCYPVAILKKRFKLKENIL